MTGTNFFTPSIVVSAFWHKCPKIVKLTFFFTFTFGMVLHLPGILHLYGNWDFVNFGLIPQSPPNIFAVNGFGRLFGFIPGVLQGYMKLPLLGVPLGIFYLSVAASFSVSFFGIRRKLYALLCGSFFVVYPSVISWFLYGGGAAFFGVMCCVLGLWFVKSGKKNVIPGILIMLVGLSIYQAYVFFIFSYLVIHLIILLTGRDRTYIAILKLALRYILCIAISIGFYAILLHVVLSQSSVELTSYQGINRIQDLLSNPGNNLLHVYQRAFNFSQITGYKYYLPILPYVYSVLGILTIALIFIRLARNRGMCPVYIALTIICLVIFPLSAKGIYIMENLGAMIYENMTFSFVTAFFLCIAILDKTDVEVSADRRKGSRHIPLLLWPVLALLIISIHAYWLNTEAIYLKEDIAKSQAISFSEELIRDIQNTPGYTAEMPVYRVGLFAEEDAISKSVNDAITLYGAPDRNRIINMYSYGDFIQLYMGKTLNIERFPDQSIIAAHAEEIMKMPFYPQKGGMKVIDGILYIRFS